METEIEAPKRYAGTKPGEVSSYHIRDYFAKKALRGFDAVVAPEVARQHLKHYLANRVEKEPPKSIYETYDLLNQSSSMNLEHPLHFAPYIDAFHKIPEESLRLAFHAPPQFGKSTTTLMGLAYLALTNSNIHSAYCTYNTERALHVLNFDFLPMLRGLGISFHVKKNRVFIKSPASRGGKAAYDNSILFTSRGASLTGYSFNGVIVIDDIVKNAEEALSPAIQNKTWSWYTQEVLTRQSGSLSIIVMMTRWHHQDLTGKLLEQNPEAEYIRLAAVCDTDDDPLGRAIGEPLWPSRRPIDFLNKKREEVGEHVFFAMYQGTPSHLTRLFTAPHLVPALPPGDYLTVYGIDLAYSATKRSDWSVLVQLKVDRNTRIAYVTKVYRKQALYNDFVREIQPILTREPGTAYWYASGMEEKTVGQELHKLMSVQIAVTTKSKLVRALDTAEAWNAGKIRVVDGDGHVKAFLQVVEMFDGSGVGHDDDVDALVPAFDVVKNLMTEKAQAPAPRRRGNPTPRSRTL